jgi:hypothetical protein
MDYKKILCSLKDYSIQKKRELKKKKLKRKHTKNKRLYMAQTEGERKR